MAQTLTAASAGAGTDTTGLIIRLQRLPLDLSPTGAWITASLIDDDGRSERFIGMLPFGAFAKRIT